MKYFFIYSAGGGAGDWNGLKRVWKKRMPHVLKKRLLLKFGDVFYNHASSPNLIKPQLWSIVSDMRKWVCENVHDDFVQNQSIILLDSGTSKIINHIMTNHEGYSVEQVIERFKGLIRENSIMQKYVEIIKNSDVQEAVTFDTPNPFKIRTQTQNTRTNVFNSQNNVLLIRTSAEFVNQMFHLMGESQDKILTTINGLWTNDEIDLFFSLLDYTPNKLAIGGLTRTSSEISKIMQRLDKKLNFQDYERVHFLGCGGIEITSGIKDNIQNDDYLSVDNSTPWNRAIDGNTCGSSQSGYFDYISKRLFRINPSNKAQIFLVHTNAPNPIFSLDEMKDIINKILTHQSNHSSQETYEARALLAIHNHDVFRVNAE